MKYLMMILMMTGCATFNEVNYENIVKQRASYDFNCPQDLINLTQISFADFGAHGCGRKKEYAVQCSLGPCHAVSK